LIKKGSAKPAPSSLVKKLVRAARTLSDEVDQLQFSEPVTHVYNPLSYAWKSHRAYLSMLQDHSPVNLFLGMNPGPWGMAQTGVPFGEIASVRDWMGIETPVDSPPIEHPKRVIEGFDCQRSEVSGRRLWGLFSEKYQQPESFFAEHFVVNYCPLVFMEASGKNRTPDKLHAEERESVGLICDKHLASVIRAMQPKRVIGVGAYAEKCLTRVVQENSFEVSIDRILHPSPASPAANKDWAGKVTSQLINVGVW
jgi:single-strand selective monofunctional uracil DNA glycosylase